MKIDPNNIAVYRQDWKSMTRYIFTNAGGSIQIELYPALKGMRKIPEAYIYGLWIDEPMRRKGFATALMNRAEAVAKEEGYEKVCLTYKKEDTPSEILDWYSRRGYVENGYDDGALMLSKDL